MLIEAICHRQRLAVVGHGKILETGRPRRLRHGLEVRATVGGVRVAVQVTSKIRMVDQARETGIVGGGDLTPVLP